MKKTIIIITVAATLAVDLAAGNKIPYTSDFYIDHTLDAGWQMKNNVRRGGIPWSAAEISDDLLAMGAKGAACKTYNSDQSQDADTWLISPALDVTAGVEYTISIHARTTAAYGETECFRITAADIADIAALKSGTVILDKRDYSNTGEYEQLTATFIPEASGEMYFGVQCYSAPDMDHLYVTRFSVTDGSGGGGDEPVKPVEGKTLPYSFDFSDEAVFSADWTSVAGPDAVSTGSWTYGVMGYANWDFTEGKKEDNWLVSPPLAVDAAGSYAIDAKVWANGRLEVLLGTDPANLSTFSVAGVLEDTPLPGDEDRPDRFNVAIEQPGTYHIAFRACSEQGSYMGHRIYYAGMKKNVVTPAIVTDLTAVADLADALSVNLGWTYPSLTNTGKPLELIVKAEVFRGRELVETFHYPRPGSPWAFEDTDITEPGVYSYSVVVHGEDGPDTDNLPIEVSAGYVGKPVMDFPCDVNLTYDKESAAMFTVEDANNDGKTWRYDSESWNPSFISINSAENGMDDYISTPYMQLKAGYYLVNFKVGGRNNTYQLGYVTDRHRQAETFVMLAEITDDSSSAASDHKAVAVIPADGDYCFTIRHTGGLSDPSGTYYDSVKLTGFSISTQAVLPGTAIGLELTPADDNSLSVTVEWTNPTIDNGGQPLGTLVKAVIYRDGKTITEITDGLTPGEKSSYTDREVPAPGDHTYKVEVHNANGCSESAAPEATVFVGPGLDIPYETTDFSEWKILNLNGDWYEWEKDADDIFGFSQSWGDNPDDYALSPLIELSSSRKYKLTVVTYAGGSLEVDVVAGSSHDTASLKEVGKLAADTQEEKEHVFNLYVPSDDDIVPEQAEPNLIPLTAGKNTFGFHATSTGSIKLKSFHLVNDGSMSGIAQTVAASTGHLSYSAGIVSTSVPASEISVYTIDGRRLTTAQDVSVLNITHLASRQTVVISALFADSVRQTLKVTL